MSIDTRLEPFNCRCGLENWKGNLRGSMEGWKNEEITFMGELNASGHQIENI